MSPTCLLITTNCMSPAQTSLLKSRIVYLPAYSVPLIWCLSISNLPHPIQNFQSSQSLSSLGQGQPHPSSYAGQKSWTCFFLSPFVGSPSGNLIGHTFKKLCFLPPPVPAINTSHLDYYSSFLAIFCFHPCPLPQLSLNTVANMVLSKYKSS